MKYGNEKYWCAIPEKGNTEKPFQLTRREGIFPIQLWKYCETTKFDELIGFIKNEIDAKNIANCLILSSNMENYSMFTSKQIAFLTLINEHCIEPYSTMAADAILWNDHQTYFKLLSEFNTIYSQLK